MVEFGKKIFFICISIVFCSTLFLDLNFPQQNVIIFWQIVNQDLVELNMPCGSNFLILEYDL